MRDTMKPTTPGTAPHAGLSIALAGSGGSGVMTAGTLLLSAAAKAGAYGLMVRTSGPQIRGGEAAALIRLSRTSVASLDDRFDLLLAIDWQNVHRFADEIPLAATSVVIGEEAEGEIPAAFARDSRADQCYGPTLNRARTGRVEPDSAPPQWAQSKHRPSRERLSRIVQQETAIVRR